jgi:hypothetical protein
VVRNEKGHGGGAYSTSVFFDPGSTMIRRKSCSMETAMTMTKKIDQKSPKS